MFDLAHDGLPFAGLEVRDVDLGRALQLVQFLVQQRRAQVPGEACHIDFSVAERSLDDQVLEIVDAVDRIPQGIAAGGIAREHQAGGTAVDLVADRRHRMVDRQRSEAAAVQFHRLTHPDLRVPQDGRLLVGDDGVIGPDLPVEDVILEYLPGFARGVHGDVLLPQTDHGVRQQRHAGNMVEVRMREKNMVDAQHLLDAEVGRAGARIDQDVVIHQQRGGAQAATDTATVAQYLDYHLEKLSILFFLFGLDRERTIPYASRRMLAERIHAAGCTCRTAGDPGKAFASRQASPWLPPDPVPDTVPDSITQALPARPCTPLPPGRAIRRADWFRRNLCRARSSTAAQ